jgi:hypothetical protein
MNARTRFEARFFRFLEAGFDAEMGSRSQQESNPPARQRKGPNWKDSKHSRYRVARLDAHFRAEGTVLIGPDEKNGSSFGGRASLRRRR